MQRDVTVRVLDAAERDAGFDDLAQLRITVFRDFPYLYDGDAAYERDYLSIWFQAEGAYVAGAFDGSLMVGACTAVPLSAHSEAFAAPFAARGLDPASFFYFGESVLLAGYRGQGIGGRFFDLREAEARRQGFATCLFSAVVRPFDHPMRPAGYRPLDDFWQRRGYRRMGGFSTLFSWKDIGDEAETEKPMQYWFRDIG